jgi:hypothetical protein
VHETKRRRAVKNEHIHKMSVLSGRPAIHIRFGLAVLIVTVAALLIATRFTRAQERMGREAFFRPGSGIV